MKTKSSVSGFLFVVFVLGLLAGCKTTHVGAQDNDGAAPIVAKTAVVGSFYLRSWIYDGGARFGKLDGVAMDKAGNLYVADSGEHLIHKISPKGEVSTFAGSEEGFADGLKGAAQFRWPDGIVIDAAGNLYVADMGNDRIRKITPNGEVSTLAGSEKSGSADGLGSAAQFLWPSGIAIDAAGNLYVADRGNHRIRKITPKGEVSTLAGSKWGFADGLGSAAQFRSPSDIAIDAAGNLYVADAFNYRIRKVSSKGEVSTLAGNEKGFADGLGSAAQFHYPSGIAIDAAGNLYVADHDNARIRKVSPKGEVSTLAGSKEGFADGIKSAAQFSKPSGIAIDAAGNLYVADEGNARIRKVSPKGEVSTFAVSPESEDDSSRFERLHGVAIDKAGHLYVTDHGNRRLHKVSPKGEVSTLAGSAAKFYANRGVAIDAAGNLYVTNAGSKNMQHLKLENDIRKITPKGEVSIFAGGAQGYADGIGSAAKFWWPSGAAVDAADNLYVADGWYHYRIRKITPKGEVSTLAGSEPGYADGLGSAAKFLALSDIAIDAAGNLYVTDRGNYRIRKVSPKGEVSTFAGSGKRGDTDGSGSTAQFHSPSGIAIGVAGNLYVAEEDNNRIRKVSPNGEVSTLAGSTQGFADGFGSAAQFYSPSGIAIDAAGNLYVADNGNRRIRKVSPKGEVSTFARGEKAFAEGVGSAVQFHLPYGTAIDAAGNLYVADWSNHRIRKITPKGEVSTLAGNKRGFADGLGSAAQFNWPDGMAMDTAGNLYVTDMENHRIRRITPKGEVSTLAGSERGFTDGLGSAAKFNSPSGIAIDKAGNLYVADTENHRIRRITPKGEVSTLAGSEPGFAEGSGSAAQFSLPSGIAMDAAGNLYVADMNNARIRKVSSKGEVSTFAGSEPGFAEGLGSAAKFHWPSSIAIDAAGNLYVADVGNARIRKVSPKGETSTLDEFSGSFGIATDAAGHLYVTDMDSRRIHKIEIKYDNADFIVGTLAGSGKKGDIDGSGDAAQFSSPSGIAIDAAGHLYVADMGNARIRKITPKGEVSTIAGSGKRGDTDGSGGAAQFHYPFGIAIDAAGNLYVADKYNSDRIRKITPKGEVSTFAGSKSGFANGLGNVAQFNQPSGIAIDAAGHLYVTDRNNHRIRKITPKGEVSTLAGSEEGFADGIGSAAQFNSPTGIEIDAAGNLYVVDEWNHRIRKITPKGEVSTLAGSEEGFADGLGSAAQFNSPSDIAIDAAGNLYVVDQSNSRIRKITPKGEVSTPIGSEEGLADGAGSAAQFNEPSGIAIDKAGNLYVTDTGNHRIRKIVQRRQSGK